MKIKLNVTQDHINNGQQKSCKSCPIATAVLEQCEIEPAKVSVSTLYIALWANKTRYRCDLPETISNWISFFDKGGPDWVKPFKTTLDFVEWHAC